MNRDLSHFKKCLEELNITLNQTQLNQFLIYYEMLIDKNKQMNLTAITEFDEVISKHFVDSLTCVKVIDLMNVDNLIDIGTGAGFPGIPIKIAFPHLNITLLDSLNKRVGFLNEVIEELKLDNSLAVHGRAEDYAQNTQFREKYDLCVSRAVANYSTLLEYCLPFIKVDGLFISYKSANIEEEINESDNALNILGGLRSDTIKFDLPYSDIGRTFLVARKIKTTPIKYPRKAGLPSKNPIK